ncbi:unnamed protein product [Effrenium voratum]|uniref:Apple domain-containing protein n=1 Tax=Effrenium voratum TaxID=2562239 RepID=A0AA36MM01_9DINO|nr:unnamed protein product [Effrenium voratum]
MRLLRARGVQGLALLGGVLLGLYVTWPPPDAGRPELLPAPASEPSTPQVELAQRAPGAASHVPAKAMTSASVRVSATTSATSAARTTRRNTFRRCIRTKEGRSGGEVEDATKEESYAACQKRCQCLEGCEFFTFWKNGNCHAQSESSTPFRNNDAVSGPAFCAARPAAAAAAAPVDLPKVMAEKDGHASRAFSDLDLRAEVGPKLYVYELPERFRNWGEDARCWTADCVFGGPPVNVHGVDIWASNQFHMPRMIYYRFLRSPQLTKNLEEAEVFLIPAYSFRATDELPCANSSDLFYTLTRLNPRLKDPKWVAKKGPRHLLMDARGWETCNYMWELQTPFRLAHRINIELNGLMEDGPEGWTYNKPFIWYQFPYPAVFHGPTLTPAQLRAAPRAELPGKPEPDPFLWSFSGTGRGQAGHLRQVLIRECTTCNRCGKELRIEEVRGDQKENSSKWGDYARVAAKKLQSTFCVEPAGDSITRKSLIDSIVLGCIPVIFAHQELDMFEAFFDASDFAEAVLFVPEAKLLGAKGPISIFGSGTFVRTSKLPQRLKQLYPEYKAFFDALRPPSPVEVREKLLQELFPEPQSLVSILDAVPTEEVLRKKKGLAKIAPRLVIGLDDSFEDAVRLLLRRIVADDQLAAKRSRESTLA